MLNKKIIIPSAISTFILTAFSTTVISATDTLLSSPSETPKIGYMFAYADKTKADEDSPHGSHGSHESHEDMKCDKKGHKHSGMSEIDLDGDGKISKEELLKHHEKMFDKKDLNNDGFIDKEEMQEMQEMHKKLKEKHGHGH